MPIHVPDREHIHHKLLDLGVPHWGILAISYALSAVLGVTAILWTLFPRDHIFLFVLGAWVLAVTFFLVLNRLHRGHRTVVVQKVGSPVA